MKSAKIIHHEKSKLNLDLDGARITGKLDLSAGFTVNGWVRISAITVGQRLVLTGGRFGTTDQHFSIDARLAKIGILSVGKEYSQALENKDKKDTIPTEIMGGIDLRGAHLGVLSDAREAWPKKMYLDGLTYDRIIAAPVDAERRKDWLQRGSIFKKEFWPQPYTQLARVLRAMGHRGDVQEILFAREDQIHAHERKQTENKWTRGRLVAWHWLLKQVIGYGIRPEKAIWPLLILCAFASGLAFGAWHMGQMAPNSDYLLAQPEWTDLRQADNPAQRWSEGTIVGESYESFSALAYGFDVVIPLIDLGQTAAWAPVTWGGWLSWGTTLWWARWVLTGAGWLVFGFLAAALTGLVSGKDD